MGTIDRKKFVVSALSGMLLALFLSIGIMFIIRQQSHKLLAPTPAALNPATISAQDRVILYAVVPGAVRSTIKVEVDNQDVFVESYKGINYARFAFTGTARVVIHAADTASYTLSPVAYQILSTNRANAISFVLTQPHKLILQIGAEKLFILADSPEENPPHPGDANVVDVTKYITVKDAGKVETSQIQQAIDAAAAQHGIVYFPNGKYVSGTLVVKSNVGLYLASGALLQGSSDSHDYQQGHFLWFNADSNAKLYGRGIIDLQGKHLRASAGNNGRIKIIRTVNAQNITLQDVLLRDAGSWTVHIVGSNDVHVTNLKIINDMQNTNNDGIDPDMSSNVTIDGAFIYTTDDCFAVKTSGQFGILKPTANILIQNAVCYDKKSALKIGTESRANISNVVFANDSIVHADRALALYMEDGSTIANVQYNNDSSESIGGDAKQRLIDIGITDRSGPGYIKNVTITDYTAAQPGPDASTILGVAGHTIDVVFKNFKIAGRYITNVADANISTSNALVTFPNNQ